MSQSSTKRPLEWSEIGVLAVLGAVIALGLAAQGLSCLDSLAAISFLAGVLGMARLWQLTDQQAARQRRPWTAKQGAWQAAVFVAWLTLMGTVAWWCSADRAERIQQREQPAANPSTLPKDSPADDDPPEQPPPNAGAGS